MAARICMHVMTAMMNMVFVMFVFAMLEDINITCGEWVACSSLKHASNSTCYVDTDYIDDDICDCDGCEDEVAYTCNTCFGGCPSTCSGSTGVSCFTTSSDSYSYSSSNSGSSSGSGSGSNSSYNTPAPTTVPTIAAATGITLTMWNEYYDSSETYEVLSYSTIEDSAQGWGGANDFNIMDSNSTLNCYTSYYYEIDREGISLTFECEINELYDNYDIKSILLLNFGIIPVYSSIVFEIYIIPKDYQSWQFNFEDFKTEEHGRSPETYTATIYFEDGLSYAYSNSLILDSVHNEDSDTSFDITIDFLNENEYSENTHNNFMTEWYIYSSLSGFSTSSLTILHYNKKNTINFECEQKINTTAYTEATFVNLFCYDCESLTSNLIGNNSVYYGNIGNLHSLFGIFCTSDESCNNTQFNFYDNTGMYYEYNDKLGRNTEYSYFTEYIDGELCQSALKGSDCVADAIVFSDCCVSDKFYKNIQDAVLTIFFLQAGSSLIGLIGFIAIIWIYIEEFMCKFKLFSKQDRMNVFKKFEWSTITCSIIAAIFDVATIVIVTNSNAGEYLQSWSISSCYTTDTSLILSELASFLNQIYLLGLLEVGFDGVDVFISLAFIREDYQINKESSSSSSSSTTTKELNEKLSTVTGATTTNHDNQVDTVAAEGQTQTQTQTQTQETTGVSSQAGAAAAGAGSGSAAAEVIAPPSKHTTAGSSGHGAEIELAAALDLQVETQAETQAETQQQKDNNNNNNNNGNDCGDIIVTSDDKTSKPDNNTSNNNTSNNNTSNNNTSNNNNDRSIIGDLIEMDKKISSIPSQTKKIGINNVTTQNISKLLKQTKCPAFVAANVTLFIFDFIITITNFFTAIYPAFQDLYDAHLGDNQCYLY